MSTQQTYFGLNRKQRKAQILPFAYWEQVQGAFRCGIMLSDGTMADGIGRCASKADFERRARHSGIKIVSHENAV